MSWCSGSRDSNGPQLLPFAKVSLSLPSLSFQFPNFQNLQIHLDIYNICSPNSICNSGLKSFFIALTGLHGISECGKLKAPVVPASRIWIQECKCMGFLFVKGRCVSIKVGECKRHFAGKVARHFCVKWAAASSLLSHFGGLVLLYLSKS